MLPVVCHKSLVELLLDNDADVTVKNAVETRCQHDVSLILLALYAEQGIGHTDASRVYETVGPESVCPSVPCRTPLRRVCCCLSGVQETAIDCYTAGA